MDADAFGGVTDRPELEHNVKTKTEIRIRDMSRAKKVK